ncbi:hypothetical protein EYC84_006399 [Monilinia fructicola]|uniref:Uncharacterized protein n=1 Tax=Monilinia fructicola TaxID=38448 RepID=A0A5M9K6S7_MONFR|nr:hypothetical protein EYC84_006399 [Monilinia fructicola]
MIHIGIDFGFTSIWFMMGVFFLSKFSNFDSTNSAKRTLSFYKPNVQMSNIAFTPLDKAILYPFLYNRLFEYQFILMIK